MAQFRPGAVAYHLHSFSARHLRTTDVWWAGPLLAAGATATMGFTEEPYLQTTPQINAFVFRFLQLGFSFGEAAYASMPSLSWQTAVIGDPLYRPFRKNQKEWYEEMERRKAKDIEWSMMMWINFRLAQNAPLEEILQFYKTNPGTRESAVLQEKLGDVYKSKGKLIDAMNPYGRALKLNMNPLQKLRVSLKAAAIFSTMGRAEQAYSIYQEVLKEYPAYPDKKDLYERLARVAATLKKNDEATEFERLAREQMAL
jgi:tetratricopeptide (TPR) repeat protein